VLREGGEPLTACPQNPYRTTTSEGRGVRALKTNARARCTATRILREKDKKRIEAFVRKKKNLCWMGGRRKRTECQLKRKQNH